VYSQPPQITPNTTLAQARDLGAVVHVVTPKQVIAPDFLQAHFKLTVPTETVAGAGDQVIDFSAKFENTETPGLKMEVLDKDGKILASGERFRLVEPQGTVLYVRIAAAGPGGAGAYTLDIDVLPQIVAVEAQPLLVDANGQPAGPINSLVITLQGDRLDLGPATAVNNFRVRLV